LQLRMASSFRQRLLGLHAYAELPWHTGLCLSPCTAIHTVGLSYDIDVVFFDRAHRVLRQIGCLSPWSVAVSLRASYVVELPAGYCKAYPDYADRIAQAIERRDHLRESPILLSKRR
jgi:uncharacterized membrane protein (UPF0127 family)